MFLRIILCIVVFSSISVFSWGQKVKLRRANSLRGAVIDGEHFDRVLGNVLFTHGKVSIYCDSAHFFKSENRIDAFGKIRIKEGDSISISSSLLSYDGNTKIAHLKKNIVFKKLGMMSLYTDFLDYYRIEQQSYYFNGGKLIDSTDTLISDKGYYDMSTNIASFKKNVVGKSTEYTLIADTLQYDVSNKIIFFRDTSTITNVDNDVMVYESGFYDTQKKIFSLHNGTTRTLHYIMKGDQYFIDNLAQIYDVQGNMSITLIEDSVIIYGDKGIYDKKARKIKIYEDAYLAKIDNQSDTLFMSADTLVYIERAVGVEKKELSNKIDSTAKITSVENSNSTMQKDSIEKIVLAYNNVKIFKADFQGIADSLAFSTMKSTIYFFNDPAIWMQSSQMTADSIHLVIRNSVISHVYLIKNPFMASKDLLSNFNQMKGRKMTAYFKNQAITHVDIDGNGESLYFVIDEDQESKGPYTSLVGMNRIICSNMRILFKGKGVNDINFYTNPDASFIPPFALKAEDKTLQGFIWRGDDRPNKKDVVK